MPKDDREEIKSRIKDAIAKMKTKSVDDDGVKVTDEIKKRGRTDKVAKKKIEELQPEVAKKLKLKEAITKKIMKKKIMEAREDAETEKLMKKLGIVTDSGYPLKEEDEIDSNTDTDTVEEENVLNEADEEVEETEEVVEEEPVEDEDETIEQEEPVEDETVETEEEPVEETEGETNENPEDKNAIFKSEDELPETDGTEKVEDVDEIISDLLESINVSVDYNNNKVEITGDDSTPTDSEPTEIETFDFVDFDKEDSEDIDKSADEDVEEAESEEEEMKESLNNLVKTFGDKYPKVFNESTLKALAEMVEKYSEAKAKVKSTKKIASIVKKVNTYMESVKADFIEQNKQKLNEAVSLDRKEKVIKKIKALIEKKIANDKANKLNENKAKKTIKILAMRNKRLERDIEKLSESNVKLKKVLRKQKLMEQKKFEMVKRKMIKESMNKIEEFDGWDMIHKFAKEVAKKYKFTKDDFKEGYEAENLIDRVAEFVDNKILHNMTDEKIKYLMNYFGADDEFDLIDTIEFGIIDDLIDWWNDGTYQKLIEKSGDKKVKEESRRFFNKKMIKESIEKKKAEKIAETKKASNPTSLVRKPVRRSDRTLTLEGIKQAVIKRKESKLTEEEIENLKKPTTVETESIDMSQFEKYIYDTNK